MSESLLLAPMPSFWQSVRMALRLDPEIYVLVQQGRDGLAIALLVVLLAALSEAAGQSVVLLINRVRPARFVLAQIIAVLSNLTGYLLWTTVIWLAVWFVFGVQTPFAATLAVVGLAYAPQLFAFFEVTPYFGNFFGLVLTLWSMAAIIVAVHSGMGLEIWQAALTGLLSWSVIQVWRRSLGRPIYALGRAVQRRAAGAKLEYSVDDAVQGRLHREQFSQNWKRWIQQQRERLHDGAAARASQRKRIEVKESDLAALEQSALHAPVRDAAARDAVARDAVAVGKEPSSEHGAGGPPRG